MKSGKSLTKPIEFNLKLFNLYILSIVKDFDRGWFRLFGIGLSWKHENCGLTFGQRNGYSKYVRIGKWIFRLIK